ncbi:MAG: bifunctional diguanylate cyclase/phosphodiesterase [Burkholderiaceae bacterium]
MPSPLRLTRLLRTIRLAAAVFAAMCGGLAWLLVSRGEALAMRSATEQVERPLAAVVSDINRSLVGLDMFLADMSRWTQHLPGASGQVAPKPPQPTDKAEATPIDSLTLLLRAALNQNLLLRDVVVLNRSGDVLLSASPSTARLGMALPEGFLDSVINQPFPAMLVSQPAANALTLTHQLYLGRSLRLQTGEPAAMVAEIHGPLLTSLLESEVADSELMVTLEREGGQLLASYPPFGELLGVKLVPGLESLPMDGRAEIGKGRLDAEISLMAVRPTMYPSVYVSVSVPKEVALAAWNKEKAAILWITAVLLSLTGLATLLSERQIRRMADVQSRMDQAHAQLQTSHTELANTLSLVQATLESTTDGILVVDDRGQVVQHNTRFLAYSGIPASLLRTGSDIADVRAYLATLLLNADEAAATSRKAYSDPRVETRDILHYLDGRVIARHSRPQMLDGEPVGRVWCYQDITSSIRAQHALQSERTAAVQAHAELSATLEALPDLLFEVDANGTYLDFRTGRGANSASPPRSILGKTFFEVLPANTAQQVMAALTLAAQHGHSSGHELLIPLPEGKFWFEMSIAAKSTPDGQPSRFIVIARDITERKRHESELQLAALVYESSSEGMAVTDEHGNIITVNPAFTHITGYTLEEVKGKNVSILNSGRQDAEFYRQMWQALNSTGSWRGELWNRHKDGKVYAEALSINTITTADGTQKRRIALFSDITQRKAQEEIIWNQANFDALTGLPNRRRFREHLDMTLEKAAHTGHKVALLFLDLDRFKEVNDAHGHDAGDLLLKTAAKRLQACVRESDLVARLGGDEFTIVLTDMDNMQRLDAISQALLTRLAEPFHLGNETEYLSASIGVTLAPDDGSDSETLIRQADQAMYAAKHLGRNRCERFSLAMQEATVMRSRIARDLRSALADQQLWLAYQPIVDLQTGGVYKAEALIRWQHPIHGTISPALFIPIAEDSGAIHDIGRWVFETAARQVAAWQQSLHTTFQVSVNKSPAQFKEGSLGPDVWQGLLSELALPPESVVLEITEGLLVDASASTRAALKTLHDAGVPLSLDDFGTGYSAMSYLHQFELDFLKIDQSFVRNLHPGSKDLALCKATIVMAHELGMKVVAEGIETIEQRDLLIQAGCDFGQGYLFARPLAAADFETLLQSRNGNFLNS